MSNYNPSDEGAPTRPMNPQPTNPQGPYQQHNYQQPHYQQPPFPNAQPPKKGGALKWVFIGCAGFLLIAVVAVGGFIWYGYTKAKEAGLDPALMQRNPALAGLKIAVMNDPNLEFISMDESKNSITVKERKSGKTITINADDVENGKIKITADGEDTTVEIRGGDKGGSVDIQTPESSVKIGGGSVTKLPSWLPQYPGVTIEGNYSVDSNEGSGAGFSFKTDDSAAEVIEFYEDALEDEGFKLSKSTVTTNGQTTASLTGNDSDYKRTIVVSATVMDGETKVNVVSQTKK